MPHPVDNLPPVHPGRILRQELEALNITADDFAAKIAVPPITVTGIIEGKRRISQIIAVRLAVAFFTTAEFWLNLQDAYDIKSGREPRPRFNLKEMLAKCDLSIPLSDEDREWLDDPPVGREII